MRCFRIALVCVLAVAAAAPAVCQEVEEEEGDGLGTLRPFRVETKEEMLQNAVFAYEIVSNQAVSAGEDAILRPAHFHRFVELALNPYSIAMTDKQAEALKSKVDAWLQKYGFHEEERADQKMPLGMLTRGSPMKWLMKINEELKSTQRPADDSEL